MNVAEKTKLALVLRSKASGLRSRSYYGGVGTSQNSIIALTVTGREES